MAFFDKFRASTRGRESRTEVDSILSNLEHVLNTKRGWGSPLADFGIRNLTEYTSREHVAKAVMDEIKENISRYEQRIRIDSIEIDDSDPSPFWISFTLQCSLVKGAQVVRVSVNTLFGSCEISRP